MGTGRHIYLLPALTEQVRHKLETLLHSNSLRARFAKGALWTLGGALAGQAIALLAAVITARMLGQTGFGELGMVQSTFGMFGILAGLGLGMTATKFVAELRSIDPVRAGRIIAMSSVVAWTSSGLLALAAFIASPGLARHVLNAPHLALSLQIGCGLLLFNSFNGAQMGALSGMEAFNAIAKTNVVRALIILPLTISGVYFWRLPGAVWAMVAGSALTCAFSSIALQKECRRFHIPLSLKSWHCELPVLWKFSMPALISGAMIAPVEWLLNSILTNQKGGYDELGLFNAARQWFAIMQFAPSLISQITLPMLSNLWGEKLFNQYRRFLLINTLILVAITLVAVIPAAVFAPRAMGIYGAGFEAGSGVLLLFCIRALASAPNTVVGQAIWSTGASRSGMILAAIRNGMLMGIFFCFMRPTAAGLAGAFALSDVLLAFLQGGYMYAILSAIKRQDAAVVLKRPVVNGA
jgi:O-antigen/teichoic acid export membrane protein